jgi:hypothetical protein
MPRKKSGASAKRAETKTITLPNQDIDLSTLAVSLGSVRVMDYAIFSDFTTGVCPDGTPFSILKHPDRAFQLVGQDWETNIGVAIDQLKGVAAKVGVEVQKKVVQLYSDLDSINADLTRSYLANYLTWAAGPCDKGALADLRAATKRVQLSTVYLRALKIELDRGNPDAQSIERIEDMMSKLQDAASS